MPTASRFGIRWGHAAIKAGKSGRPRGVQAQHFRIEYVCVAGHGRRERRRQSLEAREVLQVLAVQGRCIAEGPELVPRHGRSPGSLCCLVRRCM